MVRLVRYPLCAWKATSQALLDMKRPRIRAEGARTNMTPKIMSEAGINVALFGMRKLGSDESGRDALFADPATGKFWELTYRQSHCTAADQPRQLSEISSSEARVKYANAKDWEKPIANTKIVQRLDIYSCCSVCGTIAFDYQPGH
jgi:hypothetical protein